MYNKEVKKFTINAEVWVWSGAQGAWHFVYVSDKASAEIAKLQPKVGRRGFGAVKVKVTLGRTKWTTSIFPTKEGPYLLPLKARVRKEESIFEGDKVKITIQLI